MVTTRRRQISAGCVDVDGRVKDALDRLIPPTLAKFGDVSPGTHCAYRALIEGAEPVLLRITLYPFDSSLLTVSCTESGPAGAAAAFGGAAIMRVVRPERATVASAVIFTIVLLSRAASAHTIALST